MDSARFGKALGIGARAAAKAVVSAADAATAESPAVRIRPAHAARPQKPEAAVTPKGLREGTRRFSRAVWTPAARLSNVLWLELTGLFFGLFAVTGASYCWHQRALLHTPQQKNLFVMLVMTVVFGYFCLSSFLRARRRSR